jgi:hypothetical protein
LPSSDATFAHHRALRLRQRALAGRFRQFGGGERLHRRHRAAPGAEILGGEVLAHHLAQVVVHRTGVDRLQRTVVIAVLEQRLPRQLLQAPHQQPQPAVAHGHLLQLPGLAAEAHAHAAAAQQLQMPVAQRGQSERTVLLA